MTAIQECEVAFIGVSLADWLPDAGDLGRVIAVFQRSCYVEAPDGMLFCVAGHRLGRGPLTLGVELPSRWTLGGLGVAEGTTLVRQGEDILLARRLVFCIRDAKVWQPPKITEFAIIAEIRSRLSALTARLQPLLPTQGLAPLVPHTAALARGNLPEVNHASTVVKLAKQRVSELAGGLLIGNSRRIDRAVQGLLGLGPGLTPSGDDLLGGLMVALIVALVRNTVNGEGRPRPSGRADWGSIVAILAESVSMHSASKTNRISAALLEQSARGIGSEYQHRLLQCLLEQRGHRDSVTAALNLTRAGHSSGWDTLTGLLLGVRLASRLMGGASINMLTPPNVRVLAGETSGARA